MRKKLCAIMLLLFGVLTGCREQSGVLIRNAQSRTEAELADTEGDKVQDKVSPETPIMQERRLSEQRYACVYLCGAVMRPGIYEVAEGTKIYEIIELAGGFAENADETCLNLAETVSDGRMIRVYYVGENRSGAGNGANAFGGTNGMVNLNTAGLAELMSLPGIGEAKASKIVEYREKHGFFRSTEEIMNVPGIKDGLYEKIKAYVTI